MESLTPESVKVTFRRLRLPFAKETASAHWAMDSACISHFWNVLSAGFPHVERFFIAAARLHAEAAKSEQLRSELEAFIGQEGHHAHHHRRFNTLMREAGLDTQRYEDWFAGTLAILEKHTSPLSRLALTAGFEHMASVFAAHYIKHTRPSQGTPNEIDILFRWHGAEEIEHKAVSFDLYRAADGGYARRVAMMGLVFPLVSLLVLTAQVDLIRRDIGMPDRAELAKALPYMFGREGVVPTVLRELLRYLKPSFHPWEVNDAALLDEVRALYASYVQNMQ
jgi:predicted metal-dependent hydrolase